MAHGAILGQTPTLDTSTLNNYLLRSGGTMTGNINMGNYKVTGLANPTANSDAVTLNYFNSHMTEGPEPVFTNTTTISCYLDEITDSSGNRKIDTTGSPTDYSYYSDRSFYFARTQRAENVAGSSIGGTSPLFADINISVSNGLYQNYSGRIPMNIQFYLTKDAPIPINRYTSSRKNFTISRYGSISVARTPSSPDSVLIPLEPWGDTISTSGPYYITIILTAHV